MAEEKKFRLWVPLEKIEKSVDDKGNEVMVVGGLASTKRKDTDDESLDPSGFDITYLKERGIVNWNHSKSPDAIIGEPRKAELTKAGLYVESVLYPDSELAQKVYKLAGTLGKNSKTRRLGYSIEGKATERDPNDESKVLKAMITNVAITINPKNADSLIDIIKGNYSEYDNDFSEEIVEADNLLKGIQGGEIFLIDINKPDGTRVTVDKEYNVSIKKDMGMNTVNGAPLMPESVEGKPRKEVEEGKKETKIKYLSKAEVYEKIFDTLGVIEIQTANKIFNKLNSITMANTSKNNKPAMTSITDDLLEKALSALTGDNLEKGAGVANSTQHSGKTDKIAKGKKPAPAMEDDEHEENETEEEEETEESSDGTAVQKPAKKGKEKMEKGVSEIGELAEVMRQGFGNLGVLLKGLNDKLNTSNVNSEELKKGFDEMTEKLEEFGNAAPAPKAVRKAVSRPAEREFEKGIEDDFEKGEGSSTPAKPTLSVSKNKKEVLNALDNAAFEKGFDPEFGAALTRFEGTGNISKGIVDRLAKEKNIHLVA